jgi:ABC-2 type transport system permease protein
MTVRGIPDMLLNYNVLHLSRRIGRGQLDHVLVQPRPVWMVLLTEGFVPWSGALYVLPGAVLLALAAHRIAAPAWPGWSVLLLVDLTASSAVLVATSVLWSSLAFPYPRAAEEISSHAVDMMTQLRAYPLDRVGTRLTGALVTVLPVAFVAWLPCRSLAGVTPSLWPALVTPLFAAAICAVAAAAFRAGLAHYLLAGSQRYLPHGHRR